MLRVWREGWDVSGVLGGFPYGRAMDVKDWLESSGREARESYRACRRVLFAAIAAGGANLERMGGLARTGFMLAIEYPLISIPGEANAYAA